MIRIMPISMWSPIANWKWLCRSVLHMDKAMLTHDFVVNCRAASYQPNDLRCISGRDRGLSDFLKTIDNDTAGIADPCTRRKQRFALADGKNSI